MLLSADQKRSLHGGSRRRSSVFPKLVFYKGSIERDDPDENPYLRGTGPVQVSIAAEAVQIYRHTTAPALTNICDAVF